MKPRAPWLGLALVGVLLAARGAAGDLSETGAVARVSWASESNAVYQVQWSPFAESADWYDVGDPVEGNGEVLFIYDAAHDAPRKCYRVVKLP